MAERSSHGDAFPDPAAFPRVPIYAWAWLQRSRPVLNEVAMRLTGAPPTAGLSESLRDRFEADPFTRSVVIGAVADIAFNGRLPERRPTGASWDRGLTWWAAAIAGVTPEEFESRPESAATQRPLFAVEDPADRPAPVSKATRPRVRRPDERTVLVAGLRELLASAEGDSVPVSAVTQLLSQLDPQWPGDPSRQ